MNIVYLRLQDFLCKVSLNVNLINCTLFATATSLSIHLLEKELRYFLGPELVREVFLLFREPSCQVVEARSDLKD